MRRIGIDLGGTKIEGVLLDERGQILRRERIATQQEGGYRHILDRIRTVVMALRDDAPGIRCIGIGTPGAVTRSGTMKNSNTVCLNGMPLPRDLEESLQLQVHIENDANCFALAEATLGAGRGADVVFGVILGTGVGGGIVLRGTLWPGPQHLAGEWGHHSIDSSGPACYCGKIGCVESFLSGPAIAREYAERTGERLRSEEIFAAARNGRPAATISLNRFIDRVGRALANVIDILDPATIVLGGGLSNTPELYDQGRAAIERYVCNDELLTPIVQHRLGDSAGVIGAALLGEST